MTEPTIAATRLRGSADSPTLLVAGPSLGTSAEALWQAAADRLPDEFEVVGWDLPGHGHSRPATDGFTVAELAAAVRRLAEELPGGPARHTVYAGVSLGGAVALELALDPGPFRQVACIAAAARFSEPDAWHQRAALVRRAGTPVLVSGSVERWFAPGFIERDPATADRLLLALSDTDKESYALACEALAGFDLTGRVGEMDTPMLVLPGRQDVAVPLADATALAEAAPGAELHVLDGCAHQPPAEAPDAVAQLLASRFRPAREESR